ncbi:MAG: immunoglobulin domain-containing protein [Verrucomicrobiota bacterium]
MVEFNKLRVATPYNAPAAPVLSSTPQSLTRFRGTSAEFRVKAEGPCLLTYQWWRNTTATRGQTSEVLSIPIVPPASAGSYRVVVKSGERPGSREPAFLSVICGYLRGAVSEPLSPDRLRLKFRLPAGQGYSLQRSLNLEDWTNWSRRQGVRFPGEREHSPVGRARVEGDRLKPVLQAEGQAEGWTANRVCSAAFRLSLSDSGRLSCRHVRAVFADLEGGEDRE